VLPLRELLRLPLHAIQKWFFIIGLRAERPHRLGSEPIGKLNVPPADAKFNRDPSEDLGQYSYRITLIGRVGKVAGMGMDLCVRLGTLER